MGAAWTTFKAVGWRLAALIAASLCFEAMVALRDWHERYAITPVWAEEVALADRKWARAIAHAAANLEPQTYASKDDMYDAIERYVQDAKNWPLPEEEHLASYHAARAGQDSLRTQLRERLDSVDDEFVATSQAIVRRNRNAQNSLATSLALLNAERAAIELGFAKRIDAKETQIASAEAAMRKAFDRAAGYARPVSAGRTAAFRLHAGDEADARHVLFILLWYGLEAAMLAALFIVCVQLLLAFAGPQSTPGEVKPSFISRVTEILGRVLGPRTAANLGKGAAALVLGAAGVVGINAAAGDSPAVVPSVTHHVESTGARGEKGDDGSPAEIPPELAKQLAAQAELLGQQARMLREQKESLARAEESLGRVATQTQTTAAAATQLASEAKTMAENMTIVAGAANSTSATLGNLNAGMSQVVDAQRWSILMNGTAARQLGQSIAGLELATSRTATGVTRAVERADEIAETEIDLHATTIQVSALGDGFLRPVNPFQRYRMTPEMAEVVMKATNRSTTQAKELEEALAFMCTQRQKMRVWTFQDTLRNNTGEAARPLLDQLMPLILKVSRVRGGNDGQSKAGDVASGS